MERHRGHPSPLPRPQRAFVDNSVSRGLGSESKPGPMALGTREPNRVSPFALPYYGNANCDPFRVHTLRSL
jgi:hypothetical protein